MPKHRKGKVKREHHMLEGLEEILREIGKWECVESIIPGRIARTNRGKGSRGIFLKYRTMSGFKVLYKRGTSVQEVFVVCKDYNDFEKRFRERFG
jgi:hypothetical protein